MTRILTRLAPVAALSLLASGLAVSLTSTTASADETFKERWCSDGKPVPCVLSATRNGVPLTSADPDIQIQMIGKQVDESYNYSSVIVDDPAGLVLTDEFAITLDLGDLRPDSTESYASRPDTDRVDDGDGTYQATFTGKPVLLTSGCNDDYPSVCPEVAADQSVELSFEFHQLKVNKEFTGFDRSQSVDSVNGIFLETPAKGPAYLTSDWANSHFQTNGTTVVKGEARFRIPYPMLKEDFQVPNPETLTSASFKGTINGKPADFEFTQDPDGGGMFVDISGVTFSNNRVKVVRGVITPKAPRLLSTVRATKTSAKLVFDRAGARGAKPTAYVARCVSGRKTLTAKGSKKAFKNGLVVKRLTPGTTYACSVRALSKAGPGKWSKPKKV